jgi:hypothetical protein
VFPKLKKGDIWSSTQLVVQRETVSKDPSVQACGIHGNITGARIDRLILDDVLDYENTRTEGLRQDLYDWYHATLAGRLTEKSKVWLVGTAYHPDDLLHRFAKHALWHARSFPIIDPDTGESSWPERWSMARIEKRREELGPLEFARQMMCQARDDGESRFQRQWIERCMARGRRAGGSAFIPRIDTVPQGFKVYTGVDLAISRRKTSDNSCLFTIGIHPDGSREVLCVESGKWSGPEIVQRIVFTHQRYHSIIYVESNAAQEFIVQFTRRDHGIPVRSFTTLGQNKAHPEFGVESIAAEMASGKWIIPCDLDGRLHPDVSAWITEMLYYDPMGHTGDRLMASWIAREGGRTANRKIGFGSLNLMRR